MTKCDVTHEALISANPHAVYSPWWTKWMARHRGGCGIIRFIFGLESRPPLSALLLTRSFTASGTRASLQGQTCRALASLCRRAAGEEESLRCDEGELRQPGGLSRLARAERSRAVSI